MQCGAKWDNTPGCSGWTSRPQVLVVSMIQDEAARQRLAVLDMTPEEKAQVGIDAMLKASGWDVQPKDSINLSASQGVAICELSFATGEPHYTLFVDSKTIGAVEEKPEGETLLLDELNTVLAA